MATLIKGSELIDGKGGVIDHAAVLVDGDRIVGAGRQADIIVVGDTLADISSLPRVKTVCRRSAIMGHI
jgi:hypothetical protein